MALSLNNIVSILSDRVGQPFNVALQNELKDIFTYKAADYTRQFLDRNPGERKQFWLPFNVPMEELSQIECEVDLECPWFRSTCVLPQPIRSKDIIWDFVGASDYSEPFGYLAPEFLKYHVSSRFTANRPKWFWQGNKLIVINADNLNSLGVRGILANPRELQLCGCIENCWDDDDPFPIAEDVVNSIIRDILNVELRNMFPEPAVVEVTKPEIKPPSRYGN